MTLQPQYFAERWAGDDDPWRIAERWYERRKRDLLMAALPRERFPRALEVGCAAGHLTWRLALRCDALLAVDVDPRAVELTRAQVERPAGRHLGQQPAGTVVVEQRWLPQDWPAGDLDLVVLSEVGYYLGADDLAELVGLVVESLDDDGVVLACHWRHEAPGYPGDAAGVHAAIAAAGLSQVVHHEEPDLLLDVWTRGEPSVARAEGWLG